MKTYLITLVGHYTRLIQHLHEFVKEDSGKLITNPLSGCRVCILYSVQHSEVLEVQSRNI